MAHARAASPRLREQVLPPERILRCFFFFMMSSYPFDYEFSRERKMKSGASLMFNAMSSVFHGNSISVGAVLKRSSSRITKQLSSTFKMLQLIHFLRPEMFHFRLKHEAFKNAMSKRCLAKNTFKIQFFVLRIVL